MERGLRAIQAFRSATNRCRPACSGWLEQRPVERVVVIPFAPLAELAAHEQQLLARVHAHERVERAQRGGLLPGVARRLLHQRAFAVHDLVVRERQHEVLVERVEHRERQVLVLPAPEDRILADVGQDVVHPAHVPLEREAQPADPRRPADGGKRRRFLGDRHRAGKVLMRDVVELAEKVDRVEVLAAAVPVGHPLARLARIVEVQHGRDGIHAQAVDVE